MFPTMLYVGLLYYKNVSTTFKDSTIKTFENKILWFEVIDIYEWHLVKIQKNEVNLYVFRAVENMKPIR
jgi:hypothetical protein